MTINDLIESEGELNKLSTHFGEPIKSNINEKIGIRGYTFDGFDIGFRYGVSKYDLSGFDVTNSNVEVNVKGALIKIGVNIDKLGDIKMNNNVDGSRSILYKYCEGCNNYIGIDFDQETRLITAIYYIELT